MLYFRTNLIVLVLASISLSGGVSAQGETTVPVPTDAPTSPVGGGDTDAADSTATDPTDVPIDGASYCTFSPDSTCYKNGQPECCGDDSIECPEEEPPCDVTPAAAGGDSTSAPSATTTGSDQTSAPPTPAVSVIVAPTDVPIVGASYCTFTPDPTCYKNGQPECCGDDSIECPEEKPPCEITPAADSTSAPTATTTESDQTSAPPTAAATTGKSSSPAPTDADDAFDGPKECSAYDTCKKDNLEGNCCPTDDGDILDCCSGIDPATGTPGSGAPTPGPTQGFPIVPGVPTDVPATGMSYCGYAPDITCYGTFGVPKCCLEDNVNCPEERPPCDIETESPIEDPGPDASPDVPAPAPTDPQSLPTPPIGIDDSGGYPSVSGVRFVVVVVVTAAAVAAVL